MILGVLFSISATIIVQTHTELKDFEAQQRQAKVLFGSEQWAFSIQRCLTYGEFFGVSKAIQATMWLRENESKTPSIPESFSYPMLKRT